MSKYDILNLELDNWTISKLQEPFEDVKFRVAHGRNVLAYIDSRHVADRLNEVVGANNWSDLYSEATVRNTEEYLDIPASIRLYYELNPDADSLDKKAFNIDKYDNVKGVNDPRYKVIYPQEFAYGGLRCTLNVLGVVHEDVGSPSYAEKIKGTCSDALKRAAVKFGIGSYLYELTGLTGKNEWGKVDPDSVNMPDWALPTDSDPDAIVQPLVEEYMQMSITSTQDSITRTQLLNTITTFGRYDKKAPLIVKRAIYEHLTPIIAELKRREED